MQNKLDIVCHAFPSWRGDYTKSTVELMKEMAVNHNVLYVDYAYTFKDMVLGKNRANHNILPQMIGLINPCETITLSNGASINVLTLPPVFPTNWINNLNLYAIIQSFNSWMIKNRMKKGMKKLGMKAPILINAFNPTFGNFIQKGLGQKATIYYCYDNISEASWAAKHGDRTEKEFMKNVDATIFSSEALLQSKLGKNQKGHIVKNGVDLSIFEKNSSMVSIEKASDNIHVVYVGTFDNRIDFELIEQTIAHFKSWQFHFVGRVNCIEAEQLKSNPNVVFYGAMDANKLPAIIGQCHAGIIPFVKNDFTKNIYPMKANEYLAMGIPVVMTDFAQLQDLANVTTVAKRSEFITKLEDVVKTDTEAKKTTRINVAKNNSWKNKAKELTTILYEYAQ